MGLYRLSMVQFLVALILLLVTVPFVMELRCGQLIESVLMTLVFLSAVLAVGNSSRTLLAAAALVAPALIANWLWHAWPELGLRMISLAAGIVFVLFVIVHLLRFVSSSPRVTSEVLYTAVAIYLMMGILWSLMYTMVGLVIPHAFAFTTQSDVNRTLEGFEALYFSYTTLSTVGFGDIVPVAGAARMLAMLESITGTFYIAMLVARLVSMYAAK